MRRLVDHYGGNFARGLLMGAFDVVPGISGGTVALIVGIYERLIASIRAAVDVALGVVRRDGARVRTGIAEIDWRLMVPLVIGIGVAIVIGARLIEPLLDEETGHPVQARAVFAGLIIGSLGLVWRRVGGLDLRLVPIALLAFAVAFGLSGLPETEIPDPALIAVFAAATVAICAMILPGVSGSFLLLAMGMYEPTLEAVNERDLLYIAIFALGAAIGLGSFSKTLNWLLDNHYRLTMAALFGLMIGALRALWPYLDEDRGLQAPPGDASVLVEVGLAAGAFLLVTAFIALARRLGPDVLHPPSPPEELHAAAVAEATVESAPSSGHGPD